MKFSLKEFDKNGVAFPFNIKDDYFNETNNLKEYNDFQSKSKKIFGREITIKPNLLSFFFDKICFNKKILENVKSLIGPNLYIWSSAIFAKPANSVKKVSYHQDNPYWQLSTNKVVTVWVALTESKEISGALKVFPKSFKLGLINNVDVDNADVAFQNSVKTTTKDDMLSFRQNLQNFLKNNNPVTVELQPNEYSIHHLNCVHGSEPNKSEKPRIGYAIRYISSDTKHLNRKKDFALHVCGKKNDYFFDEIRPNKDFSETEIKNYESAMKGAGGFGNKHY
tara:strand:- start:401 stop:1240 length:840 start_codon:yes stop_codon:yes gene_type:complete